MHKGKASSDGVNPIIERRFRNQDRSEAHRRHGFNARSACAELLDLGVVWDVVIAVTPSSPGFAFKDQVAVVFHANAGCGVMIQY